jgi:hypothetical protein
MRTADILQMAHEADPELMKEAALHLALLERVAPQFVPEVVEEFQKISQRVSEKTKEAGVKDFLTGVGKNALGITAGTVAAGIGLAIATDLYNSARKGLTKGRNYRRMMEANPELKNIEKQYGKERFNTMFGVLHRNAPDLAADPFFSGAFMSRTVPADKDLAAGEEFVETLLKRQKLRSDTKGDPFKGVKFPLPSEPDAPLPPPPTMYEMRMQGVGPGETRTIKSPRKPW